MRVGHGAAHYLFDLHSGVPFDEMRKRYRAGYYGKLRQKDVAGWNRLAGRTEPVDPTPKPLTPKTPDLYDDEAA